MTETHPPLPAPLRRRVGVRFSLRTVLILVTLACCWLGWHINAARRQKEVVEAIREFGGWVRYGYQFDEDRIYDPKRESWAPAWAIEQVGHDFFHPVVEVNFVYSDDTGKSEQNSNASPVPLDRVARLPKLRALYLQGTQANDSNLAAVAGLKRLERLMIWDATEVTDAGVAHFSSLRHLTYIHLSESQISDNSLAILSQMPKLEALYLQFNQFTGAGVSRLQSLRNLRTLAVCGPQGQAAEITDASLEFLLDYPHFDELGVQNTRVTQGFLDKLRGRFPKCSVYK